MPRTTWLDYVLSSALFMVMLLPLFAIGGTAHALWTVYYGALLASVFVIDLRHRVIPDRLLLFFGIAGVLLTLLMPMAHFNILDRLAGGGLGGGVLLVLALVTKGFGGGDIKYMFLLGLLWGVEGILQILVLSFLFGFAESIVRLIFKRMKLTDTIAFGPAISMAVFLLLLLNGAGRIV